MTKVRHALKNVLLTGGTGQLGRAIQESKLFPGVLTPSRRELDITDFKNVCQYFDVHKISAVIHCAALARIAICESKPGEAIDINVGGTGHLVKAVLRKEKESGGKVRFLYVSTDGVYPGLRGRYQESAATMPYNNYGWTKLACECIVHLLTDYCIIRTNFFDPAHIEFSTSAVDIFTSKLPLQDLVAAIKLLLNHRFVGVINVGGERMSDYQRYKKYDPRIRPCTREEILKHISFQLYSDASLNTTLWKKLKSERHSA